MGSSFLTVINVLLALYCVAVFFKMLFQFGLPGHPARFTLYLVSLCATGFFTMKAMTDLHMLNPFLYMKWSAVPLVAGGLGFLLQVVSLVGHFSLIQQKIISRMPLIGALLVFAFFPEKADLFLITCLVVAALFLSFSVRKARYQKRMIAKMLLFLTLFGLFSWLNNFWLYIIGELFLFPALFYFFIFQQSFGITALVEESRAESSGGNA